MRGEVSVTGSSTGSSALGTGTNTRTSSLRVRVVPVVGVLARIVLLVRVVAALLQVVLSLAVLELGAELRGRRRSAGWRSTLAAQVRVVAFLVTVVAVRV